MCGIAGVINFKNEKIDKKSITSMVKSIEHRGPNDNGIYFNKNFALGSTRLSIIDLSKDGHMPMFSKDKRYVIVYNGEIYNHVELRKELSKDYDFKSQSDTEVVLAAYGKWGKSSLNKFNGMFSFVIYDHYKNSFFAARDRYGIKPFYYYSDKEKFIFCSEISPIVKNFGFLKEPDDLTIYNYLIFNKTNQNENTFFKKIKKLQHGHYLTINNSNVKISKWYDISENLDKPILEANDLNELIYDSIKLRLRSDVPVGACLSGGLDSSIIVGNVFHNFGRKDIHTFSAVYNHNQIGDETEYINEFSNELNNMHFTKPTAKSLYNDYQDFILYQNEPVPNTSAYAEYMVMKVAKDYVTVILNGQGADEELAGYKYFFGYFFKELLMDLKLLKLIREVYKYLSVQKSTYGLKAALFFLLSSKIQSAIFIQNKKFYDKNFINRNKNKSDIPTKIFNSSSLNQSLIDHFEHQFEHHLIWGDRSSMKFSLELRFPFLDHRIVESTLLCDHKFKIKDGYTKNALRQISDSIIPEKIRLRKDKMGFSTPEDEWFREPFFKDLILDILHSKKFSDRGYIDKKIAIKMFHDHLNKKSNISQEIWKWINLETWFNQFID